jgi:hypothetical protein
VGKLAPPYTPRRPTETVLYAVVRDHLETFLRFTRETYEKPLPRYVENELRAYLKCGVFAHGFVRARCDACGHDLLVAFSCKRRDVCPSCAGRRMANTAAHLVDRVLPDVPVRQYVLSLPFELRLLAAFKAPVLGALSRIFIDAIFTRYKFDAKRVGLDGTAAGAVTFVQRFGSSLNLNVHFHVVCLDGVFARDATSQAVFHPSPPPTRGDLEVIVKRVARRAHAWLVRRGLVEHEAAEETAEPSALDACAALAMRRGSIRALRDDESAEAEGALPAEAPPAPHGAIDYEGFNLEASVRIEAGDDMGRERLCRYGARPPLALDRLRRLSGGRIAYRIKKWRHGRAKNRVMAPLELLARLSALVAPPRYPLVRYHGVLAPKSPWRKDVVPKPPCSTEPIYTAKKSEPARPAKVHVKTTGSDTPRSAPVCGRSGPSEGSSPPQGADASAPSNAPAKHPNASIAKSEASAEDTRGSDPPVTDALVTSSVTRIAPNMLSVRHWERLMDGLLYAATPRVDWATLLRRTFEIDVMRCPTCDGRLRVLGSVTEPGVVRLMLERLGMPSGAPRVARARDPTESDGELFVE